MVDYVEVDSFIENKINDLDLSPEYLTIISSPNVIPFARNDTDFRRDWWQQMWGTQTGDWIQIDGSLYGDLNDDFFQDISVGRIFSYTLSDISSYISRDIFYEFLPKSNSFATLTSFASMFASPYTQNLMIDAIYLNLGLQSESTYHEAGEMFSPSLFENKAILAYRGHSGQSGGSGGFNTQTFRANYVWLSPSIVTNSGCLSCSYDTADFKSELFCAEMIRRGALAYIGATDVSGQDTFVENNFLRELIGNKDIGHAFKEGSNVYFASQMSKYSPWQTLLGDPTFNPHYFSRGYDLLNLDQTELIGMEANISIKIINISLNETITYSLTEIRTGDDTNINVTTPPAYLGENSYKSEVNYFSKYRRPNATEGYEMELSSGELKIFFNFPNPASLRLKKVNYAEMTIGEDNYDISDQLTYDEDDPFDKEIYYHSSNGISWVLMSFNLNQNGTDLVEQDTEDIPPIKINLELEFEEQQ